MIEELLESPGFWILGGGGTIAVVLGFIMSKRMTEFSFPLWQLAIIIIGVLAAAAFFALRE